MSVQRVQVPIAFSYQTQVYASSSSSSFVAQSINVIVPAASVTVTITDRNTHNPAVVYAALTGTTTLSSVVTDTNGNVPGYVVEGSYTLTAAPSGSFVGATVNWEAVRGDGVENVYPGAVDVPQLTTPIQQSLVPTGSILPFGGSSAPAGFLLCTGSVVSQTTYANLYAVIGTTWNTTGEGTGNFRIPDLRGATLVGAGTASWGTSRTLGKYGLPSGGTYLGEETHRTVNAEMPAHSHGGSTALTSTDHYHTFGGETGGQSVDHSHTTYMSVGAQANLNLWEGSGHGSWFGPGTTFTGYGSTGASTDHAHAYSGNTSYQSAIFGNYNHSHVINSDGGTSAHNNMPPFGVVNYVIKT